MGPELLREGDALGAAALVDRDKEDAVALGLVDLAVHADLACLACDAGVTGNGGVVEAGNHQIPIEVTRGHAVAVNSPRDRAGRLGFDPRSAQERQSHPGRLGDSHQQLDGRYTLDLV